MSDILQNLITEPYDELAADADFFDASGNALVDFIIEDKGNLDAQLKKALAQGTGLACIIDIVDGRSDAPGAPVVSLVPVSIVCELSEKVLLNRQGTAGEDYFTLRQALAMIMAKLHHFQYSSNAVLVLAPSAFRSSQPARGADAAYQIFFETTEAFSAS